MYALLLIQRGLRLIPVPHVLNTEDLYSMKDHGPCQSRKPATEFSTSASRKCRSARKSQCWNIFNCEIVWENWEEAVLSDKREKQNPSVLWINSQLPSTACLPFSTLTSSPLWKSSPHAAIPLCLPSRQYQECLYPLGHQSSITAFSRTENSSNSQDH